MRNDIPRAWGGLGLLRRVGDASPSELERSLSFRLRRRVNDLWGITYIYHVSGPHQMGKGKELLFIKEEGEEEEEDEEKERVKIARGTLQMRCSPRPFFSSRRVVEACANTCPPTGFLGSETKLMPPSGLDMTWFV